MSLTAAGARARWLLAPAVDEVPRRTAVVSAGLRILVGLLWLYNVSWKQPPDFGREDGNGLFAFTKDAVDHPVFAPYSWVVEHVVLPNFTAFGWGVLVVETTLAVLLLTGAYVRLAAVLGTAQSLAIGLSVAQTPGEWPWAYWMMIGIHVVLLFGSSGRVLAVDALRARRDRGQAPARPVLPLAWGLTATAAGVAALVICLGDDPLADPGAALGGPDLSISLGSYNIVAAVILIAAGLSLVGLARTGRAQLGRLPMVLGVLAALSLYVQLPFNDTWLGGTNTSAAFFLCIAVIGGSSAALAGRGAQEPEAADAVSLHR